MPAVNWDQPSTGLVTDPNPSLELNNDKGGALLARSRAVAVDAVSKDAEALRAQTRKTLTARIASDEFIAALATAPKATALIGANEAPAIAVAGVNLPDPAKPFDSLDGVGVAGLSSRMAAVGVLGFTLGARSTAVWGNAQGGGVGVRGQGSSGGVEGRSTQGHGVAGVTQSDRASGVYGFAPGVQGAGVSGQSAGGAGVDGSSDAGPGVRGVSTQAQGVVGESTGMNASGVLGRNDLANGAGVDGASQSGIGVRALTSGGVAMHAEALTGLGIDVSNFSASQPALKARAALKPAIDAGTIDGPAVFAIGVAHAGVVAGTIAGPKPGDPAVGCGVYGTSLAGAGVCGQAVTGTGVLGIAPPQFGGWAGRFEGDVHVSGFLFKSASLFSIDHPLDPKRKVLNHASVEAPEYKTFYDGVVTLGPRGEATVRLPRWFDALNQALRYQLTPIGAPAPELHVAREAKAGSFAIAGGRPGQKVCWQVTGVRRDAWAKAHPLEVEQARKFARAPTPEASAKDVHRAGQALQQAAGAIEKEIQSRRVAAKKRASPRRAPEPVKQPEPANDWSPVGSAKTVLRQAERLSARSSPAASKA